MTLFAKTILAILLMFPANRFDTETKEERTVRLTTIAMSIDYATDRATCSGAFKTKECKRVWVGSKESLALALIVRGHFESHFAQNVHAGKCKRYQCDPVRKNGTVVHRARTIWQLQWERAFREEWNKMVGTELQPTQYAAWAATKKIAFTRSVCKRGMGVSACRNTKQSKIRIVYYHKLAKKHESKLRRARN